jgi:hypothetical protein
MKSLLALLSLLTALNILAEIDCSRFSDLKGCLLKPEAFTSKKLLIYLRGHFEGEKPPHPSSQSARKRSLNECAKTYGLTDLANKKGMAILFTSVATATFSSEQVKSVMDQYQLEEIYVASHSGSFRALNRQIDVLSKVKEVYLLDNFYGDASVARELDNMIEDSSITCRGFLTSHNKDRFTSRYKNSVKCKVESSSSFNHFTSVAKCLDRFLEGKDCQSKE